ncbi:MAG: hybrid sensor histidine kinase/response regulator [Planctomycetales bacterium]|nr:hybrid sensor histidine kinase/response regulator [Planctomycetales bacterium]
MLFDKSELLEEFLAESREHLAIVEDHLLKLEGCGDDVDVELVNTVFRAIHTVKGDAGFLGLRNISHLAHCLENLLGKMRSLVLLPTAETIDIMLRATDALLALINDVDHSEETDVTGCILTLDEVNANAGEAPDEFETSSGPIAAGEAADTALRDEPGTGDETAVAVVREDATEEAPQESEALEDAPESSADARSDEVQAKEVGAAPVEIESSTAAESSTDAQRVARDNSDAKERASTIARDTTAGRKQERTSTEYVPSLRVPTAVLDQLMNTVGELVLGRNQLVRSVEVQDLASIQSVTLRIDQIASELQEAVTQTRMHPLGNIFGRFPRVVRDLSSKLGKQCSVVVDGEDVEVDKTIVEAIGEPLTHLVRNAVDHGIEDPHERLAVGKPAAGVLRIKSYHAAGKVHIDIEDDGAGIDTNQLRRRAVSKGLLTPDVAGQMSDHEALQLIFRPGFSTAAKISDVSGRGVGMDVVRTKIEKMGGAVEVDSKLGVGTAIQITLPLTLAIIPSMLVSCRGRTYAIPQMNIVELVRVRAAEIEQRINCIKGSQVLRLRGRLLPLIPLEQVLGVADSCEPSPTRSLQIVIVGSGQLQYGLMVDRIDDAEEIVVKMLGRHLKKCNCLSGATILGDGQVAPILDVAGIAAHCDLRTTHGPALEHCRKVNERGSAPATCDVPHVGRVPLMVFAYSRERFAIPMGLVSRIERVRADDLESCDGCMALHRGGSAVPLLNLADLIDAPPALEMSAFDARPRSFRNVYVVVFRLQDKELGLVVPHLIDVGDVPLDVDPVTFRRPGVAGSLMIEGAPARLLDLPQLAALAFPDRFKSQLELANGNHRQVRVLLAESSPYFCANLKANLESAGVSVATCEDGETAWEQLTNAPASADLVIVDVDCPRVNGMRLIRNISRDVSVCHLPVIATSSAPTAESHRQCVEAGAERLELKYAWNSLLSGIAQLALAGIDSAGCEEQVT